MQTSLFDSFITEEKTGFRLETLEVYNWGTFNHHVWKMKTLGANALLTGDIGSGKSTLVDAITTLLVPHQKITFNKAAGAANDERTLASYIRGEYKNLKSEDSQNAKPVALREKNTYSVILATFHNEGFEQNVTLAQVFWLKDQTRQVERFFVFSDRTLNLTEHFGGFGTDILELKKRLRHLDSTQVFETFKDYSSTFRGAFGIQHEQALNLFYQTISMKTVGNLTEFVRSHMLEKGDSISRIEDLKRSFENLSRAHQAVLEARTQIEILKPIVEGGHRILASEVQQRGLVSARDSLASFMAEKKIKLLDQKQSILDQSQEKLEARLQANTEARNLLSLQEAELRESIRSSGGGRIENLSMEIERLSGEVPAFQKRHLHYESAVRELDLSTTLDSDIFFDNRRLVTATLSEVEEELRQTQEREVERTIEFRQSAEKCRELESEIQSLLARKSNIPSRNLDLRRRLCQDLNFSEQDLPFVGEQLQVTSEAAAWTGAIERVLHGFALSLLVKEADYATVSKYVDNHHLRGKLVYFRSRPPKAQEFRTLQENSLASKLEIKPGCKHADWLQAHLSERFDYVCCEKIEDFHLQPFALTRNGQLKAGGSRHEKDDRAAIQDRSQYVLGWENESKLQALKEMLASFSLAASEKASQLEVLKKMVSQLNKKRDLCKTILSFDDFTALDWRPLSVKIQNLISEKRELEKSSDHLLVLRKKLDSIVEQRTSLSQEHEVNLQKKGNLQAEMQQVLEQKMAAKDIFEARELLLRAQDFPLLDSFLGPQKFSLGSLERAHSEQRVLIQTEIDKERRKCERIREEVIRRMLDFIRRFPSQSKEMDGSIETLGEFERLLRALHEEDLPRHEEQFRKLLNEGAINGVALFRNQLEKEAREIENKISLINRSLVDVEYSPGTFIELICERTPEVEIRQFLADMKACTEHGISDDTLYDEIKFLRVKQIMDRFQGRESFAELDRRWTAKVTDVRNWFLFSAREAYFENKMEKEFYSDSGGKSGGQKEKLAYTVLASALAYQFGLEWNTKRSKTFRFVVIDEAFGRGSDESARFGLELFRKLHLQLLVVTPLQKIHVIEDYVNSVHFVHNESGQNSQVRSLTIDEYRDQKQKYRKNLTGEPTSNDLSV